MNRLVLYHANCADGFGAAWAAWKKLGNTAEYIPVQYGQPVPPQVDGAESVYIVDFSYPLAIMRDISARCGYLMVIDHHASAERDLKVFGAERGEMGDLIFDKQHSGAVLTWTALHNTPVPKLLDFVEDRDLWRWELPDSKAISACIASRPWTFAEWDFLSGALEYDSSENHGLCVAEGESILRYQAQIVDRHVQAAKLKELFGPGFPVVPVVNATCLVSEIGHALCEAFPQYAFSASYYDRTDDKRIWSLRSIGAFDVSEFAKARGGGGHKNAAGFTEEGVPNEH